MKDLNSTKEIPPKEAKIEELKDEPKHDDSKLELKILPPHLKYVFLEKGGNRSVITRSSLSIHEEHRLIQVLKKNKKAICYVLLDLKGISRSYSMHKIKMEENFKIVAQPQQ